MSSSPVAFDRRLIDALRGAKQVVVFTGAGVSQESGIPTFREKQTGLWQNFDAAELATPAAFRRDPAFVWGWYEWRRTLVRRAHPNAAHLAIAAMALEVPQMTLITQNVDDLHERAGSRDVLHLHGQLAHPYCEACRRPHTVQDDPSEPPGGGRRIEPPRCRDCGARVRPGVVWFGEALPIREWQASQDAARSADVFFCVGTSSTVQPAASLTELAIQEGAVTVEINPNATDVEAQFSCRAPAGTVLPLLLEQVWKRNGVCG
jgi:NAD-dependent deacetylase